mgnify:CR=1 FL=1
MKFDIKKDGKFFAILIICIILIILLATYTLEIKDKLYTKGEIQKETGVIEQIQEDTEVTQSFVALENNLEKVTLDFESYKDDIKCGGKTTIGIKDSNGKIIKEETISRNYIRENSKYTLKFKKQKDSKDKEYDIYIKFKNLEDSEKFYTLKVTDKNQFMKNKMYINGEEQENTSLIFQDYYKSNIRVIIFTSIMALMIMGVVVISTIIYYKRNIKVENLFLMIVPFVCLFFMITMPTFKNHDEYYHWLKAYEVSEGHFMTPIENGVQGSQMPDAVWEVFPKDWTVMDYSDVKEKLNVKIDEEKQGILNPETAAVYSFVQYIPQATGIIIAKIFTNNAYIITYVGRIVNMIVAMALLYLAIKIIPFGKKLILLPAMIPIAIEGFTSLSPDAMTISMSFLYIAYILHLAFGNKEKILVKDKIILLVMSVVIALCKIVYIPLVGLILIIPKEKFKNGTNKNKTFNFCIIAGIALVINLIWLGIAGQYLANFREGDSKIQVLLALKNPIKYIQMLLYTINLSGNKYLLALFGAELGWGEFIKLYSLVPYAFIAIYIFAIISDQKLKNKFKKYQLIWMTLVVLAVVALIFTSLYVQWTYIGSVSIAGVQGRYFLPILPLIALILGSILKIEASYKEENVNKFVAISTLVLQIYTISQILVVHL